MHTGSIDSFTVDYSGVSDTELRMLSESRNTTSFSANELSLSRQL